ncbi:MAG: FAD-dependent oxidoreductase, partial [Gammaproteobacteria bacterium]
LASPDPAPDAAKRTGSRRFDTQYWTANVIPSDRYVLSLPGSHRYRISPLDMSCDNLTIAGDWTASGLDSGCIESAVISGMLAAHAIARKPELSAIVGYNHP